MVEEVVKKLLIETILPILVPAIERVPREFLKQSTIRDFLYSFLKPILALPPIDITLEDIYVGRESILSKYTDKEIAEEVLPILTIGEIKPRTHIYIELNAEKEGKELSCVGLLYVDGEMKVTVEDFWVNELPRWSHSSVDWASLMSTAERIFWIVFTVVVTKLVEKAIKKILEKEKEN